MTAYHLALALAYLVAAAAWLALPRALPGFWPVVAPRFSHPWREVGWTLVAVAGVLGVGALYSAGIRLSARGPLGHAAEALNQLAIFSPIVVLLLVRRAPPSSFWLRAAALPLRLLAGVVIAIVVVGVFTSLHGDAAGWGAVLARVPTGRNAALAVQVLLEDLTIAVLLVRLQAAVGSPFAAAAVVGLLFAAGHIPALLAGGASGAELLRLGFDAALATVVVRAGLRAGDLALVWPVHTALDLMQFVSGARLA